MTLVSKTYGVSQTALHYVGSDSSLLRSSPVFEILKGKLWGCVHIFSNIIMKIYLHSYRQTHCDYLFFSGTSSWICVCTYMSDIVRVFYQVRNAGKQHNEFYMLERTPWGHIYIFTKVTLKLCVELQGRHFELAFTHLWMLQ